MSEEYKVEVLQNGEVVAVVCGAVLRHVRYQVLHHAFVCSQDGSIQVRQMKGPPAKWLPDD